MATYENAARAKELIRDVAQINNQALTLINSIADIRARLLAATQATRDAITAAVGDMGYDAAEIQAMLAQWNQVKATVDAQGIASVPPPR